MDAPLLETKLRTPVLRHGVVIRRRLADRLSLGVRSKLTLISAPAGFGKSTLVGEWIADQDSPAVAWLSLDTDDNDPAVFWTYAIAALQRATAGMGTVALDALQQQTGTDFAIRTLLNELVPLTDDVVLVLDDYHVIDHPGVHEGVAFLLEHLPPRAHLVIVTRADPPLPLSRLRARGELVEIRAAELRFTADEAAAYLNGTMDLALTAPDVVALETRTEGWIAALQLAALSIRGRADATSFIASFAGDDRFLVDYLADEVLARLPQATRNFLMQTAVLDRLTASLCDAVTGGDDGKAVLDSIDRANLFLVPLDDRRHWFRYHHLFGDVLRARLADEAPDSVAGLHRRASDWFAHNGDRAEAIRHALAAGDVDRAADLMELAVPEMRKAREELSWRRWLDALPVEVIQSRPVLAVTHAGVLMSAGEFGRVEELLRAAERWLSLPGVERSRAGMVVVEHAEFERLPSAIALYRTAQARIAGDIPGTIDQARRALELAAEDDLVGRGSAAAFLGLAHWTTGDIATAYRWYTDGMASMERAGHLADVVAGAVTQSDLLRAQGRLTEALTVLERGLATATPSRRAPLRGAPDMHVGIGDVLLERNDLAGARRHIDAARASGDESSYRQFPYRSRVVMAGIHRAEGDTAAAHRLLDEAELVYVGEFTPDVRPIAALRARLWIEEGELAHAWEWAGRHGLGPGDPLTYVREFEHATLARLLIAQGRHDRTEATIREGRTLADRLLVFAEQGARNGSALDALVALALAQHADGDQSSAIASILRAAALAEKNGHVRVFLDEGAPMAALLRLAARQPNAPDHVRRLAGGTPEAQQASGAPPPLIEPLSERELDVLRLLGTDLDGPGIAHELVVALSTVRTHTQNVYAKLGVNNRRAAVRRAEALGLLHGTRH